ncbi:MAG: zinc ribbon domain-containing protein [Oscillospiraceae bacterium]|nr:zinc ribbon domain-containing protein [Oscillospiraceae bacterium]
MDRIKNWFRSLGSKMQSFMYGRYGYDELSQFLSKTALLCVIVGLFAYPGFFCGLAMALYLVTMFRMYSKNIMKRKQERDAYLRRTQPLRDWQALQKRKFNDRKTHKFYRCSQCKTSLRVPKGKGKIKIHCPKCGAEIVKKT